MSLALALGALVLALPSRASEDAAPRVLVSEDFEAPRALPAFATYEKPPRELLAQVEKGEPWHLIVEAGSAATAEIAGGAAVLRIERAGTNWYAVQHDLHGACRPAPPAEPAGSPPSPRGALRRARRFAAPRGCPAGEGRSPSPSFAGAPSLPLGPLFEDLALA